MKTSYSRTLQHSRILSQTMVQAVKIMRMNRFELHEFLADLTERNPFVEVRRRAAPSGFQREGQSPDDVQSDTQISLYRFLADQFPQVFCLDEELRIAFALLQEIDPSGWLTTPVERIAQDNGLDPQACHEVLGRLQTLEPSGVFASDLKGCLRRQAMDRGELDEIMEALIDNLDQLVDGGLPRLAKRLRTDVHSLALRLGQIRRMNPKPGSVFGHDEIAQNSCDVVVSVSDQGLSFELTRSSYPTVRLAPTLAMCASERMSQQSVLRDLIREAKAVRTAVEMRKSTTLAVVAAVFLRQRAFLVDGFAALVPMRMSDIADDIGVSEATVSRISSALMVQCPRGSVALKSLFCSPVSYGDEAQTKHVTLKLIQELIADEDKSSPLTDQKITCELQSSGFGISRRTVTKYRQSLGFAPPARRRQNAELTHLLPRVGEAKAEPTFGRTGVTGMVDRKTASETISSRGSHDGPGE